MAVPQPICAVLTAPPYFKPCRSARMRDHRRELALPFEASTLYCGACVLTQAGALVVATPYTR